MNLNRKLLAIGVATLTGLLGNALLGSRSRADVPNGTMVPASSSKVLIMGRTDYTNFARPRFWAPGVTVEVRFEGPFCYMEVIDQQRYNKNHNYLEVRVDGGTPFRVQTTGSKNEILLAKGLGPGAHTVTVTKDTEASIGYLELVGFRCEKLLSPPPLPRHKIEFIGDSITCGFGDDQSTIPCGKGTWYDEHNAYLSYGPITARHLDAQWHITAYSGIGLIRSCCGMAFTMPEIWDTVNIEPNGSPWRVKYYRPDVVTICLGQNDGVQPENKFVPAYVSFVNTLHSSYPKAHIVLLSSPMASPQLNAALHKYLPEVVNDCSQQDNKAVSTFFFSKDFGGGCGNHPDLAGQRQMATELIGYLANLMHWKQHTVPNMM